MSHASFLYIWNWFIIRCTTYWFEFKKYFQVLTCVYLSKWNINFIFKMQTFFYFQIQLKSYFISKFYFRIQIKNDIIFKIQTIFTFKFDSKLAFMYKYQHDSDGPPYRRFLKIVLNVGDFTRQFKCCYYIINAGDSRPVLENWNVWLEL